MTFGIDNLEEGCNNPPEYVWTKCSGELGLNKMIFWYANVGWFVMDVHKCEAN